MRKRHRHYFDADEAPDVLPPNTGIRVTLADSQSARQRRTLRDMVASDAQCWAGHRPGPLTDHAFSRSLMMDARFDLANAMRDQAHAEQYSRQLWRDGPAVVRLGPAEATPVARPLNSPPPLNEPLAIGETPTRPPLDPVGENGNGDDDDDPLAKAMADRERARLERDQRGDSAYKNPPNPYGGNLSNYGGVLDPREADRVEAIRRKTVLR
jgi:hypothetical protein